LPEAEKRNETNIPTSISGEPTAQRIVIAIALACNPENINLQMNRQRLWMFHSSSKFLI